MCFVFKLIMPQSLFLLLTPFPFFVCTSFIQCLPNIHIYVTIIIPSLLGTDE